MYSGGCRRESLEWALFNISQCFVTIVFSSTFSRPFSTSVDTFSRPSDCKKILCNIFLTIYIYKLYPLRMVKRNVDICIYTYIREEMNRVL